MTFTKLVYFKFDRQLVLNLLCIYLLSCDNESSNIDAGIIGDGNFESMVRQSVVDNNLPSLTVIISEEGEIVESAVAGTRAFGSGVDITEQDLWQIGSITKSFTATLAAKMIEYGLIDWNHTIEQSFQGRVPEIHSDIRNVTLADLLRHQGGIRRDQEATDNEKLSRDRDSFLARALARAPVHVRGEFNYSNLGYLMAGEMLANAAGTSWEQALDIYLLSPLGITDFEFGYPSAGDELEQPVGHMRRTDQSGTRINDYWLSIPAEEDPFFPRVLIYGAAGALSISKQDLTRYLQLHIAGANNETTFLSQDSFSYLHQATPGEDYAMGWSVWDEELLDEFGLDVTDRVLSHAGSVGTWSAFTLFIPEKSISIFIASNSSTSSTRNVYYEYLLRPIFKRLQIGG